MNPSNVEQGFFGIKVSKPGVNVNQANSQNLVYESDYSSTIYYDTSNSRFIEGKLPDGTYGVWVSKPGLNANDPNAAINNNLLFNSNQDFFKIIQTGVITLPGTGNQAAFATGATGITVAHNLGYAPSFSAFTTIPIVPVGGFPPVSAWNQQFPCVGADSHAMTYNLQCGTDSTNIYFVDFWSNNGNVTPVQAFTVTYYLFTTSA